MANNFQNSKYTSDFKGLFFIAVRIFFYTHLGYSLNFTVVCHCQVMGGIPPPSGGIVGENQCTRSIAVRIKENSFCIHRGTYFSQFLVRPRKTIKWSTLTTRERHNSDTTSQGLKDGEKIPTKTKTRKKLI